MCIKMDTTPIGIIKYKNIKFPSTEHFCAILTENNEYLHLSYVGIESTQESYNFYFDELNKDKNIYTRVSKLSIETDFIYDLPSHIFKFINLTHLSIAGSRFWDLNMTKIPNTAKVLHIEDANCGEYCLEGIEGLCNLEELHVNLDRFNLQGIFEYGCEDNEISESFIHLPNLKKIWLRSGVVYNQSDLKENWRSILLDNISFQKIRENIVSVDASENPCKFYIVIFLK